MDLKDLYIKQIMVGPMMNFAYLVGDKAMKIAAIIDPGWEADKLIAAAEEAGLKLTHILLTHGHFDHANDVGAIAKKLDVKICVHKDEASDFQNIPGLMKIDDGETVHVGNLKFDVIHTPGHTPGGVCYLVDSALFTGDTLFVDNIGRIDLPGSDGEQMFKALTKLRMLPDKVIIYPGHHYGNSPTSTIGEQKRTNPYFQCTSLGDFLRIA